TMLVSFILLFFALGSFAQTSKYKGMVQMTTYQGLEAYVFISLIDPNGNYEKTLYVLGPDKQWYNTLKEWHKFESKAKSKLSAITGASLAVRDRTVKTIEIDDSRIDKGYKLRFESALEEPKYHTVDVDIPPSTEKISERVEGKGYFRFVKLSK